MTRLIVLLLALAVFDADAGNECKDGIDNDLDGLIDTADLGCRQRGKPDETNCGDGVCEGGESVASCAADCYVAPPAPLPPVEIGYLLENQTIPGIDRPVRIRAVGHAPADSTSATPLVLINNLNHGRCFDPVSGLYSNTLDYDCPTGAEEVPLAEGMRYLTLHLAERGFVAASIDSNQMVHFYGGGQTPIEAVADRARLVRAHLDLWRTDPPAPADPDNLITIGHSMGGGVSLALPDFGVYPRALYLIAPATMTDDSAAYVRMGLLLSGCDEDAGTHNLPGLHVFDRSVDGRTFDIEQAYLTHGNHNHFNTSAWSGGSGCTVPAMDATEQRLMAADIIATFLLGEKQDTTARLSTLGPNPKKLNPSFEGFSERLDFTPTAPYAPDAYYWHRRPSIYLEWQSPARISVPLVSGRLFSFRATQVIRTPHNTPDTDLPITVRVGSATYTALVPWPVNDYEDPCGYTNDGLLWCFSWWALPREILHSIAVPTNGATQAEILFDGQGAAIVADFEVTD